MSSVVLDASALLAVLQLEHGAEQVFPHLSTGLVSAVNLAEVITKLIDNGEDDQGAVERAARMVATVAPFDDGFAAAVGALRRTTRVVGLSLGDRACIALAQRENLPVLTADRAWASLDLGVQVVLIR